MVVMSRSPQQTHALGRRLADLLAPGDVILLRGDLGCGKTVFVQGLGEGLGCEDPVHSPTYTMLHCYAGGRLPLYHADLYRLRPGEEADEILPDDVIADGVCAVEWPDMAEGYIFTQTFTVAFTMCRGETRQIEITSCKGLGLHALSGD